MTDVRNGEATTEQGRGSAAAQVVSQFESSPIEAALAYAREGWAVFPCFEIHEGRCSCSKGEGCQSPGKHPRTQNGVKNATTDEGRIRGWWSRWPKANVAIAAGSGLVVVDVDVRKGGFESVKSLDLTETLTEMTGGGGRHHLYRIEPGETIGNWTDLVPGVDIKSDGGYIVAAPSNHILGGVYAWSNWGHQVETLPSGVRDAVLSGGKGESDQIDTESVLAGVPEGQRDDALFRAACSWRRLGLGRSEVATLTLAAAAKCTPPFPDTEALVKVEQAFAQDHDDYRPWMGEWATRALTTFDPFAQLVAEEAARIRVRDEARRIVAVEKAGRDYPSPEVSQDGLLTDLVLVERVHERQRIDGLMGMAHNVVIAASYKSGKTTMGGNVLKAAADGVPFLDRDVNMDGGRIAWLNGEMDRDDFLDYLSPHKITNLDRIVLRNMRGRRMSLLNDFVADEFVKWLIDNEVEWLWADSWRVLCSWSGINENRNEEVELLTAQLDRIKREANVATFTALAHTGRAQQDEGAEHARGATALDDWQDVRWVLTRSKDDRFLKVEGRGRGIGLDETRLLFDPGTRLLSLGVGNRAEARSGKGVDLVAEFVTANPGCTSGDVRSHLLHNGIGNAGDQTKAMKAAVDAGLIHFTKQGVKHIYTVGPDPNRQWAQSASLNFEGGQEPI